MPQDLLATVLLPLMLAFIMFSLGLGLTPADFRRIVQQPRAFLLGIFSHFVLLPLFCFGLLQLFPLPGTLAVGFMLIAACPTGTTSNLLTYLARGDVALALSFTAAASLLTIITLPLILALSMNHFLGQGQRIDFPVGVVAGQVFALLAIPVGAGMLVRHFRPALAARLEQPATRASTLCFALIVLAAVAKNVSLLAEQFATVAPMALGLNLLMLTTGFVVARLGRLNRQQSVTLAIETGMQNATLAIVIATSILGSTELGIPGAMYGVLMYVGGSLFAWLVRPSAAEASQGEAAQARR